MNDCSPMYPPGPRALLLDGHEGRSFSLAALLAPLTHTITVTRTAEEALEAAHLQHFDFAVIAVDGDIHDTARAMAALRLMHAGGERRPLPIITLGAANDNAPAGDRRLCEPLRVRAVEAAVSACLQPSAPQHTPDSRHR